MVNLCVRVPSVLLKFMAAFRDVFSVPLFKTFAFYVAALMYERKRTNIQTVWADVPVRSYDQFQYMLSRAKWDYQEVNRVRVQKLQSDPRTRSSSRGCLAIDDTANPKSKSCKSTEGVAKQYCAVTDDIRPCHSVVFSAYCDEAKRWPVNFRPYRPAETLLRGQDDPDFKSKLTLACDLIDEALALGIQFSDVLFDNWYFKSQVIQHAEARNLTWISEAAVDTIFFYKGKRLRAEQLVELVPPHEFKEEVTLTSPSGKERRLSLAVLDLRVRMLKAKYRVVIAKGPYLTDDPDEWHVYVTNHRVLSGPDIVCRWGLRWGVEEIFRELKDTLGFDQYQVRSLKAACRHWELACVAHSFLVYAKQLGVFHKETPDIIGTLGDVAFIFRNLAMLESRSWLVEHREQYKVHTSKVYVARNPRKPRAKRAA